MIDTAEDWRRLARRIVHRGHIVTLLEDDIVSPSGDQLTREIVVHPGSVAVLAADDDNRLAVVHQYRAPHGMRLVELPAGLLDMAGETPLEAAQRELVEEAGLAAADWRVLVDYCPSPGISDEVARIFLARGLSQRPRPAGYAAHGEEIDMGLTWLPLAEVLASIRAGQVHNGALVLGANIFALALRDGTIDELRPGDAPWWHHNRVRKLNSDG